MNRLIIQARIALSIAIFLFFLPLLIYFIKFGSSALSTDQNVWGTFGDFFGGVINPIVGLVNLILIYLLAIYVAQSEDDRKLTEYRYTTLTNLSTQFESATINSKSLTLLLSQLKAFKQYNKFLFPPDLFDSITTSIINATEKLLAYQKDFESRLISESEIPPEFAQRFWEIAKNFPPIPTAEEELLEVYNNEKSRLIAFMQTVIIKGDLRPFQ